MPHEEMTYREYVKQTLDEIKSQTIKTNGRVTKMERNMLIVGTAVIVIILLKVPELLPLLRLI